MTADSSVRTIALGDLLEVVEDELAALRRYDQAKAIRGWLETLEEHEGGLPPAVLNRLITVEVPVTAALEPGELLMHPDEVDALRLLLREDPVADLADVTTLGVEDVVRRIDAAKALLRSALEAVRTTEPLTPPVELTVDAVRASLGLPPDLTRATTRELLTAVRGRLEASTVPMTVLARVDELEGSIPDPLLDAQLADRPTGGT